MATFGDEWILFPYTTCTSGLHFKCMKDITQNDIIVLCDLLTTKYNGLCTFQPEAITEGGIKFVFNTDCSSKWYKSVRLCVERGDTEGKWYWVDDEWRDKWTNCGELIFEKFDYQRKPTKFSTFLKSFHGAPVFTIEELNIWEECFEKIGIRRIGIYPSKKSLLLTYTL